MGPTPLVQKGNRQTKTPLRTLSRTSPRSPSLSAGKVKAKRRKDKFDFDAPQFEDFTRPRYQRRKQQLDEIVLSSEKRKSQSGIEWQVSEVGTDFQFLPSEGSSSSNDEWFQSKHSDHEYSSPQTPAGPLVTPDPSGGQSLDSSLRSEMSRSSRLGSSATKFTPNRIKSSPLSRLAGNNLRPITTKSPLSAPRQPLGLAETPGKYVSPHGLRSKPMRILNQVKVEDGDEKQPSPQSLLQTFYPEMMEIKSPTGHRGLIPPVIPADTRWARMEARSSTSIEQSFMSPGRNERLTSDQPISSPAQKRLSSASLNQIASVSAWSSIPETPPILSAKLLDPVGERGSAIFEMEDFKKEPPGVKRGAPSVANEGSNPIIARRIGLTSRALRVPAHSQSNEILVEGAINSPKPPSPALKRLRVDARFCPAPPALKSKQTSPTKSSSLANTGISTVAPKKEKPVKVDDLKRLLAEHNQKLRNQVNITRRR